MNTRTLHRWLARISLIFIAISVVTGLLWAYAPYLYWPPGYKSIKHEIDVQPLDAAQIKLEDALTELVTYVGESAELLSATLKPEAGRLVYIFHFQMPDETTHAAMLDAISGAWLSPLIEQDAIDFARLYVEGKPAVKEVTFLLHWEQRKPKIERPVWYVSFDDVSETEIFIDPYTGEILEDQSTARRFHFWVMKLHQYQFFGTNKELSIIAGLPLFILLVTGTWLAFPKLSRRFRARHSEVKK